MKRSHAFFLKTTLTLFSVCMAARPGVGSEFSVEDWRTDRSVAHPVYDAFWGDVILRQPGDVVEDPEALLAVVKRTRTYRELCSRLQVEDLDLTHLNRDLIQFYVNLVHALSAGRSAALAAVPDLRLTTSDAERSRARNNATRPFTDAISNVNLLRQATIRVMLTGGDVSEADVNREVADIVANLTPSIPSDAARWRDTRKRQRKQQQEREEAREREEQAKIPTQDQLARLRARILETGAKEAETAQRLAGTKSQSDRLRIEAELTVIHTELERLRGIWETNRGHDTSAADDPFEILQRHRSEQASPPKHDLPFEPIENPTPDQIRRLRTHYVNQRNAVARLDDVIKNTPDELVRSMLQTQRDSAQEKLDKLQIRWDHYKQYDPTWTE